MDNITLPMSTPTARRTDPSTSHLAAASVRVSDLPAVKQAIVTLFAVCGPMTDEQLWDVWQQRIHSKPISPSGLRTRRRELADAGWIRDSGSKRPMSTGRMAIVWEAA